MDDIYFSDKKRRDHDPESRNEFLETDYFDEEFSLDFKKGAGNAQSFISESEKDDFAKRESRDAYSGNPVTSEEPERYSVSNNMDVLDRTPQGRPVSQQRTQQPRQSPPSYQRPVSSQNRSSVPSRTPTGQRVSQQGATPQQSAQSRPVVRQTPPTSQPPRKKAKKNSNAKTKALLAVVAIFAVALLALFGYGYMILGNLNYDDEIIENRYLESASASDDYVKNILFIGSDARGDVSGQRSDTMILFSIDTKNRQIKLSSFLRDSYLYVPFLDYKTKVNASYSFGGAQATIDALEYNFGVDIDNYVMVDFETFEMIVDHLGGITVDVTANEAEYMRDDVKIPWVQEGENEFNGFVSLWYCRIRYLDNDFNRTGRQRKVISAIIDKATKTNPITLMNMVNDVVPNISTDLTRNELLVLGANAMLRYMRYDIVQQQVPADGTWYDDYVDGSYVLRMDVEENAEILQEFLANKVVEETEDE